MNSRPFLIRTCFSATSFPSGQLVLALEHWPMSAHRSSDSVRVCYPPVAPTVHCWWVPQIRIKQRQLHNFLYVRVLSLKDTPPIYHKTRKLKPSQGQILGLWSDPFLPGGDVRAEKLWAHVFTHVSFVVGYVPGFGVFEDFLWNTISGKTKMFQTDFCHSTPSLCLRDMLAVHPHLLTFGTKKASGLSFNPQNTHWKLWVSTLQKVFTS